MNYYIDTTEEMGRGNYAAYDIKKGSIIFTSELLVLSPEDTIKVNETDLKWYTFVYNETQDCLVLGDGEIFNHADIPNTGYKLTDHNGRKLMTFYALTDIPMKSQLFIDYGADTNVDATKYTTNLF